jgi:hypothetical protein
MKGRAARELGAASGPLEHFRFQLQGNEPTG